MKPLKVTLVFFILFFSGEMMAQTNFLKGYYISLNKDTIHGFIENRFDKKNYSSLTFKTDLASNSIHIHPESVILFSLNGQIFEFHTFEEKNKELLHGFFKVIIIGKLTLLENNDRYFVKTTSNELFEITRKEEIIDQKIRTDYSGMGILINLMQDCSSITRSYLESEYKLSPGYKKILIKYNECMGTYTVIKQQEKFTPQFNFGVLAALDFNSLTLHQNLDGADFGFKPTINIGVFTSIFIPRISEKFRLLIEATYGRQTRYTYFEAGQTNNDLFINFSTVKVPIIFRYENKWINFDFGISNSFVVNQDSRWRVENFNQSTISTSEGSFVPLNPSNFGFLVGLGTNYKLNNHVLRAGVRYNHIQDKQHSYEPLFRSIQLQLSFQF